MNRPGRRYLPALLVLPLVAGAAWALLHQQPAASRPDIVLIVWDTCRGDRVQPNGYALPTTPNLLSLAAEGTTFRQCFTPSPWTPPAHASLFTGLLPRNHGLREELGDRVKPGIPLLAETLRAAGYETVSVAANAHISPATGLDRGFDRRIQCFDSKVPGVAGMDVGERVAEWIDGRSRRRGAGPFFLFVNQMETHVPYAAEEEALSVVRGPESVERARAAARRLTEPVLTDHIVGLRSVEPALFPGLDAAYDGAVRLADRTAGRILDRLRAEGLLGNAVVVVCGDHGENLGEHGALGHAQSLSEQVLHVPLVVRWPGRLPAGAVEDAQVRLQDVYPTLLEAAGVPAPPGCGRDSASLTENPLRSRVAIAAFGPSLGRIPGLDRLDPGAPPQVREQMYRAFRSVREPLDRPGARKFVAVIRAGTDGSARVVREALYDLAADPGETRNLLSEPTVPGDRAAADRLRAMGGP